MSSRIEQNLKIQKNTLLLKFRLDTDAGNWENYCPSHYKSEHNAQRTT